MPSPRASLGEHQASSAEQDNEACTTETKNVIALTRACPEQRGGINVARDATASSKLLEAVEQYFNLLLSNTKYRVYGDQFKRLSVAA